MNPIGKTGGANFNAEIAKKKQKKTEEIK